MYPGSWKSAVHVAGLCLLAACAASQAPASAQTRIAAGVSVASARLAAGEPLDTRQARSDAHGRLEIDIYVTGQPTDALPMLVAHGLYDAEASTAMGLVEGWALPRDIPDLAVLPVVIKITLPRYARPL